MRQIEAGSPLLPPLVAVEEPPDGHRARLADVRWRAALLAGYVFLLPVQLPLGPERRLAISDVFILLYLIAVSFRIRRMKGAWSIWYPALLAVIGMGLLVSLATTRAVTEYAFGQKALGLAFLMVTMACLVDFLTSVARIRWLLRVFMAGVLLNVVVALLAFVVQLGDRAALPNLNYLGTRLSGLLVDPNAFGGLIACALMLHLFTARTSVAVVPARLRVPTTAVLAVGLLLTFSRSAWIAALLGTAVAVLAVGRWAARAVVPLVAGAAVAVPVLATLYVPDLQALAARPNQISDRVSIINQGLNEFVSSPIWGVGLGVFPERYDNIVHNTTIWFLAEMGVIGLVVFVGFVTSFAARLTGLLHDVRTGVATLALAALAAHASMLGLSIGIEALYQRQWWLIFAIGGALSTLPTTDRR